MGKGKKLEKSFHKKKKLFNLLFDLALIAIGELRKKSLSLLLYNFISVFFITLSLSVDFRHILIS